MPENQLQHTKFQNCREAEISSHEEIFGSEEEMRQSISRLCYGDLYVIGRLWIEALKAGLVGSKWSLIPVVEAARPPVPPEKPPLMRYKDLPLYTSPHYEYKDFIADKDKCPKANVKLAQEMLFPYVRSIRKSVTESCCEMGCEIKCMKNEIACALNNKKNNFKCFMRHPDNLLLRQAVVAIGGATGFYIGSGRGLPTKFFSTGLGLLAAGALCFPKETDAAFRTFSYHTAKTAIGIYNFYCNKMFAMRERMPCPDELPPPPVYRKPNVCPKK